VSAAELSPAPAGLRADGRVVELASGLLMLLDEHGITGRLPLDARAQASRLRHAVKLTVQASAAGATPPPAPAAADPALALRAWIRAQPWANDSGPLRGNARVGPSNAPTNSRLLQQSPSQPSGHQLQHGRCALMRPSDWHIVRVLLFWLAVLASFMVLVALAGGGR
jgi:hypothetical protein